MEALEAKETLEIENFLSIKHVKLEFSRFNIISGDMAAGKSLCIKIVKFFEDIIPDLLIMPYNLFIKNLENDYLFEYLAFLFKNIFYLPPLGENRFIPFKINYSFSFGREILSITISGSEETAIIVESVYLRNLLKEWQGYLEKSFLNDSEKVTYDGFRETKSFLYYNLQRKFGGRFPVKATFIPASRAALALSTDYTDFYLKKYNAFTENLRLRRYMNYEVVEKILKAKIRIEDTLYLDSTDGRRVPLAKASSGQQEVAHFLMHLERLGFYSYTYGKTQSLFIEEPSAYLSPQDEKQLIEFIVEIYNRQNDSDIPIRFFITTYSLYVFNSLNNMLKKGALIKKYENQSDKINSRTKIPSLYIDEVSAYYIDNAGRGNDILNKKKNEIKATEIEKVLTTIKKDSKEITKLNEELSHPSN